MNKLVNFSQRRKLLYLLASFPIFSISGCALIRQSRKREILGEPPSGLNTILRPWKVRRAAAAPPHVIDVHAHFFNARDVPVRGYLSGPVAHSKGGVIGKLLKALAPIAEWISITAPRASDEFNDLVALASGSAFSVMGQSERIRTLERQREQYLQNLSVRVYEQLRLLPDFVRFYNAAQSEAQSRIKIPRVGAPFLDERSLFRAMRRDLHQQPPDIELFGAEEPPPYADGVLAFVGYMLSYRWMNLLAYQRAYSTGDPVFGVNQVLGLSLTSTTGYRHLPARHKKTRSSSTNYYLSCLAVTCVRL